MGASTLLLVFNKILGKTSARIQRNWRTQRTFKEHFPEKIAHFFTLLCRKTSQNSFLNLLSPISLPYSLSCSKQIFASITVLKQPWSSSPMTFMFLNPMVQYLTYLVLLLDQSTWHSCWLNPLWNTIFHWVFRLPLFLLSTQELLLPTKLHRLDSSSAQSLNAGCLRT